MPRRPATLTAPLALTLGLTLGPALAAAESAPLPPPVEQVDVLVVVDSTAGMADERAALAGAIDDFVRDLQDAFPGDYGTALSLHLGVITADLGAGGHAHAGCAGDGDGGALRGGCAAVDGAFLQAEVTQWGKATTNFDGEIGAAATCLVPIELDGCPFQQPLGAAVTALTSTDPANAGFLRPDALLAVLVVSNQDDCSAPAAFFDPASTALGPATPLRCAQQGWTCTPPLDGTPQVHGACAAAVDGPMRGIGELVAGLEALKTEPGRIVVGTLRGSPSPVEVVAAGDGAVVAPSCGAGTDLAAAPGLRLDAFAAAFPERHAAGLVCLDGYGTWLDEVVATIHTAAVGEPVEPPPGRDAGDADWYCDGGWWEPTDAGEPGGAGADPDADGCSAGGGASGGATALTLLALLVAVRGRRA